MDSEASLTDSQVSLTEYPSFWVVDGDSDSLYAASKQQLGLRTTRARYSNHPPPPDHLGTVPLSSLEPKPEEVPYMTVCCCGVALLSVFAVVAFLFGAVHLISKKGLPGFLYLGIGNATKDHSQTHSSETVRPRMRKYIDEENASSTGRVTQAKEDTGNSTDSATVANETS